MPRINKEQNIETIAVDSFSKDRQRFTLKIQRGLLQRIMEHLKREEGLRRLRLRPPPKISRRTHSTRKQGYDAVIALNINYPKT